MPQPEITIKRMKVPSADFPSADLRVEPNTKYEFRCASCGDTLFAPLGWIASTDFCTNEIDPEILAAIDRHFHFASIKVPHSQQYNIVQCPACDSIYIVYVKAQETSMGAYRAMVSSVNQVLGHEI
jgi:ribosomal protein S27E